MTKIEIAIGDAVFSVDIEFDRSWPAKRWHDTAHFHVDSEIHIILSGNAVIEIGGKDVHIHEGDVCLLSPGSSHYPKICSDDLKKTNFSFNLIQSNNSGKNIKEFSEYVYYAGIFKSLNDYLIISDAELLSIMNTLLETEFSNETRHIYTTLLALFFITLAKQIKNKRLLDKNESIRVGAESENSSVQRKTVEAFFQNRYGEEIRIEDLAKELCLSVPHTHRIVKKVFDEGFKKTLVKQRIEHACMLIKQRDLTLTEIAYSCGYTSYNGFLSAFKSYMGKTPKEYEKSIR